jgi:hypothetical protein
MPRFEQPQVDIQLSNFSFQTHGHRSDSVIDTQIEQVPPDSQTITPTDLQHLEWRLNCTSLDDYLERPVDVSSLARAYSSQFGYSHNQNQSSSQIADSDPRLSKHISRKQQRKYHSRLQPHHSQIRSIEALAKQFDTASAEQTSQSLIPGYGPSSQDLNTLVEDIDDVDMNEDSTKILLNAALVKYRRSRDLPAEASWVEKPIRVRKNTSAKKRRA